MDGATAKYVKHEGQKHTSPTDELKQNCSHQKAKEKTDHADEKQEQDALPFWVLASDRGRRNIFKENTGECSGSVHFLQREDAVVGDHAVLGRTALVIAWDTVTAFCRSAVLLEHCLSPSLPVFEQGQVGDLSVHDAWHRHWLCVPGPITEINRCRRQSRQAAAAGWVPVLLKKGASASCFALES